VPPRGDTSVPGMELLYDKRSDLDLMGELC